MSLIKEDPFACEVRAIKVRQPIGDFFIASIPYKTLVEISYFDVRRMLGEREFEEYLGIQRALSKSRVAELAQYVQTVDACFPTAVILAVEERCAEFKQDSGTLVIRNDPEPDEGQPQIFKRGIAKVLDGQHRIAGLEHYKGKHLRRHRVGRPSLHLLSCKSGSNQSQQKLGV
jgi:DGQHR domain-containing protein